MKKNILKTIFAVSIICTVVINFYSEKNTVTNMVDLSSLSKMSFASSGEDHWLGKNPDSEVGYLMVFNNGCYICKPEDNVCNVSNQCCKDWGNCPG